MKRNRTEVSHFRISLPHHIYAVLRLFLSRLLTFFWSRVNKNTINAEVEPPFEPREVHIRRGQNVRDKFILEQEIGR